MPKFTKEQITDFQKLNTADSVLISYKVYGSDVIHEAYAKDLDWFPSQIRYWDFHTNSPEILDLEMIEEIRY